MTGSQDPAAQVAQALLQARDERTMADAAPFAGLLTDAAQAYEVQDRVAKGMAIAPDLAHRYWKSGGPSRSATLTHAALPPAGVWQSPATAEDFHFNRRVIESEVALRLARDVTPEQAAALTHENAGSVVDAMCVSIEIVDFRWQQAGAAPALLKLADLQSHGALVLGEWVPYRANDWAAQVCEVLIGDNDSWRFTGTHPVGEPAWLLPIWLNHVTRNGETAKAGTVVTTGSWCGMLPAAKGDNVVVRFPGIGEASVQL